MQFRADQVEKLIQPPMKYCLSKYDSKLDIGAAKAMMWSTEALTEEAKSYEFRSKPDPNKWVSNKPFVITTKFTQSSVDFQQVLLYRGLHFKDQIDNCYFEI